MHGTRNSHVPAAPGEAVRPPVSNAHYHDGLSLRNFKARFSIRAACASMKRPGCPRLCRVRLGPATLSMSAVVVDARGVLDSQWCQPGVSAAQARASARVLCDSPFRCVQYVSAVSFSALSGASRRHVRA